MNGLCVSVSQTELNDLANDLRTRARKWLKKPSSFALTLVGTALSVVTAPLASVIKIGGSLMGYEGPSKVNAGAYSYLFNAQSRFGG